MFRTIRWRLVASYSLVIFLAVALMGALALSFLRRYVDRQERDFLQANAVSVVSQAQEYLTPPTRHAALQELAYASAFLGNARVRILDADKKTVLADSGDPSQPDEYIWLVPSGLADIDMGRHVTAPFILSLPSPEQESREQSLKNLIPLLRNLPLGTSRVFARRFFTPWGRRFEFGSEDPSLGEQPVPVPRNFLTVTMPVKVQDQTLGYIEMSSPLSLQSEAIGTMSSSLLFSGLAALAVAVAFGLLFGKTLTDPVTNLAAAARKMARGDLSARAEGGRQDEMGALAHQFNSMAENLERSFRDLQVERDSLKRFVADASHELRTPITALSTFIELLQGRAADDPKARMEFLQESQTQIRRLEWITSNLLDLSRLDAGISSLSIGEHDLTDLVEAAVSPRGRFTEKGIELSVSTPSSAARISCDSQRVIMALSNLAANALKFTPAGGRVELRAEIIDGTARFTVSDTGPGIDPGDLPRVWERFYRGKNNGGADGAGLGLAIVKSVADAHGGSVSAASEPGKGSTFVMEIPARM